MVSRTISLFLVACLFISIHQIANERLVRRHPNSFRNDDVPNITLVCVDVDQTEISRDLQQGQPRLWSNGGFKTDVNDQFPHSRSIAPCSDQSNHSSDGSRTPTMPVRPHSASASVSKLPQYPVSPKHHERLHHPGALQVDVPGSTT